MCKCLLSVVALVLISPAFSFAWDYTGHRVIASIAYRQLGDQTKRTLGEILKKHPANADLWVNRPTNGPDEILNLLWSASIFPDDARSEPWRRYGRSAVHYVNYRILSEQGNKIEPTVRGGNILNSYTAHLKQIQNPRTMIEDKTLHLSWVFHQAGDIHMPLHA
jgi:S1/P1 Nuclease